MEKLKVGYIFDSYPYQRNVIDKVDGVEYVKVFNVNQYLSLLFKVLNKVNLVNDRYKYYYGFSFNDYGYNKIDLLHTFNSVSFSNKPWLSTFETFIPRYSSMPYEQDNKAIKELETLAKDSCKKIIAISECTKKIQLELLDRFPKYRDRIKDKICVIHPPQKLFVRNFEEKNLKTEELSFIFVGREFFRKGGMEILTAFTNLKEQYRLKVKLTMISSFIGHDYATKATKADLNKAKEIINNNRDWITYYPSLPNDQVIALMKKHHVGLLPTWADTYGYSVLEMQASGCPVITTDVRALPEINDNNKGWVIKVPKDKLGEAFYSTQEERNQLSAIIEKGLERNILNICQNTNQLKIKSEAAIRGIKMNHSPEKYAQQLGDIYQESILRKTHCSD
ncbi:glycosyltransferase family 4 protein [Sporolactobacillus pectinivorans]|uniref:glycosyltransferase family 4 protein n=1 Tax=Sporolactobacillus pectinivorans TaxID=1591408 RepID=UPI000C2663F4|nr:glycosyltransferase family 4 protein [Sporolactobacillus pectinivorans]